MMIESISRYIHPLSDILGIDNRYAVSILILILTVFLLKISLWLTNRFIKKILIRTKTKIDDILLEKTGGPFFYVIALIGIRLAILPLNWDKIPYVRHLINSLIILFAAYLILKILNTLIEIWGKEFSKKTKTKVDNSMLPLIKNFSNIIILSIALVVLLGEWGVNIGPLLASLGIAGIVIGFALQDSLKNIFGGVALIIDHTYKVGDKIKMESGETGIVHDVGIRSTKIRTFDNEIITIPNGLMANQRIQNYTQPDKSIRVVIPFSVEYGAEIDKVRKTVLSSIRKIKEIEKDPRPSVIFIEMGESALNFKALFWVPHYSMQWNKKLEAVEVIYNSLNKAGIGIPFPTRTVYMKRR